MTREVNLSLADKVWFGGSVQYSTSWYWHGTFSSDGSRKLVASFRRKTSSVRAALLVRSNFFGDTRSLEASTVPSLREALR